MLEGSDVCAPRELSPPPLPPWSAERGGGGGGKSSASVCYLASCGEGCAMGRGQSGPVPTPPPVASASRQEHCPQSRVPGGEYAAAYRVGQPCLVLPLRGQGVRMPRFAGAVSVVCGGESALPSTLRGLLPVIPPRLSQLTPAAQPLMPRLLAPASGLPRPQNLPAPLHSPPRPRPPPLHLHPNPPPGSHPTPRHRLHHRGAAEAVALL